MKAMHASDRSWGAVVASAALLLCAACSEPASGSATSGSAVAALSAAPSASAPASEKVTPPTCPMMVKALGMDRGFPVIAPTTKKDLDAAVAELEDRIAAFDDVKSVLDPEPLRVGGELAASFAELVEMMKQKPPEPEQEPREGSILKARPTASASAKAPAPLYDSTDWGTKNERFVAAWKGVAELCH